MHLWIWTERLLRATVRLGNLILDGSILSFIDVKNKTKLHELDLKDTIECIKWFPSAHLVIVTRSSYHMWDGSDCKVIHDRSSEMKGLQIVDVALHRDGWCAVSGIKPKDGRIVGTVHLFSVKKTLSVNYSGHCGAFVKLNDQSRTSFIFYSCDGKPTLQILNLEDMTKLASLEVFLSSNRERDFPIKLVSNSQLGIMYVVMKSGSVHVYDLTSRICLQIVDASSTPIFFIFEVQNHEFGIIDRLGNLKAVSLNPSALVKYVGESLGQYELSIKYAKIFGLELERDAFIEAIAKHIATNQIDNAVSLYCSAEVVEQRDVVEQLNETNFVCTGFILELAKHKILRSEEAELLLKNKQFIRENLRVISDLVADGRVSRL